MIIPGNPCGVIVYRDDTSPIPSTSLFPLELVDKSVQQYTYTTEHIVQSGEHVNECDMHVNEHTSST